MAHANARLTEFSAAAGPAHHRAGLAARSSRAHHCPHGLPAAQVRRVLRARRRHRQGPHRI